MEEEGEGVFGIGHAVGGADCGVEGGPDDFQPWRWPLERVLVTGTRALRSGKKQQFLCLELV